MPPSSSSTAPTILIPPPLSPPNPSILTFTTSHFSILGSTLTLSPTLPQAPSQQPPHLFLSALSVRIPVFVHEQRCSLEGEIDADDARSWHFVAFDGSEDGKGGIGKAVAALRLVPPDSPLTTGHGAVERERERVAQEDEDGGENDRPTEPYHGRTAMWDGREKYIKIGRMAALKEARGKGVAPALLEYAMQWAAAHRADLRVEPSQADGTIGNGETWHNLVLSHAQTGAKGWWTKMGFVEDEGLGTFWEEGIEHVGMWRRLKDAEGEGWVEGGNDAYRRRTRRHAESFTET